MVCVLGDIGLTSRTGMANYLHPNQEIDHGVI